MMNCEDKRRRRSIRLKNYDYSKNGAYFVTLCTFGRTYCFDEFEQLCRIVVNIWLSLPDRYENLLLDEFVIMPNHFHGIVIIQDTPQKAPAQSEISLGSIIGSFKSLCVNAWLKILKDEGIPARGRFWQDNYFEHVVRNEAEMDRIREYVRDNPPQWELDPENRDRLGATAIMAEKWMV